MRVDFSSLMFPCFPCCTYILIAGADAFGLQFRQLPNHLSHAHAEHTHTHTLTGTKGHTDNRTIVSGSSASSACFPFPLHEIPTTSSQVEGENPSLWAHLLMPQLPVVILVVGFPLRQQIKRKSATFRTLAATEGSKTGHRCC